MQGVVFKAFITELSQRTEVHFLANMCGFRSPDFKIAGREAAKLAKTGLKLHVDAGVAAMFHAETTVP
jgi:hypothetical protein